MKRFIIYFSISFLALVSFLGGGYAKKNCYFPYCKDLTTYWVQLKDILSQEKPVKTDRVGLIESLSTNFSEASLEWINLQDETETLYGGLHYDNQNNVFIYVNQLGKFYEIDKTSVKRGTRLNIPDFDTPPLPSNDDSWDLDYSRLGIRDFIMDEDQEYAILAVSEADQEKTCHQVSVYVTALQSTNASWSKKYTSKCWTVGIADAIGGGLAISKKNVYLTIGTNSRFTGVDFFEDYSEMIEKEGISKIVEIDLNDETVRDYATGFRNSQGITISPNGKIYTVEHGPQGGDELNLVEDGKHYGFPELTLGVNYGETTWPFLNPDIAKSKRSVSPIYSWVPSIAPSDLEYNTFYKKIDGLTDCELVTSTLREESLYFLRLAENCTKIINIEKLYIGERIRKLAINPKDKTFLFTTDGEQEIGLISFK